MSRFSVRYYSVEKEHAAGPSLINALEQLGNQFPIGDRQTQIMGGMTIRLERFEMDGSEATGEFTRVQTTDFPYEVSNIGINALNTDGPIGDGVAFRFRPSDHTLAMQYDSRIVSPGRAVGYLKQQNPTNGFLIHTKLDGDAWQRFDDGLIRDFTLKIASPDYLENIENEADAVAQAIGAFSEAYSAPIITINFGMGHKKGFLSSAMKVIATQFSDAENRGEVDIRSLKAKVKSDEAMPAEDINLLDQVFSDSMDIAYPPNDPDQNYALRKEALKGLLNEHRG